MSVLLRSTKLVRYFTGAARTLLFDARITEPNLLNNIKVLNASNNVQTRNYTSSKKPERFETLLQKLESEVRRFGRVTIKDIDDVLNAMKSKSNISSSQALLVIKCCGDFIPEEPPEQKTLLVQKIWNVLAEHGIPLDVSHYNVLLRVYIENEHPFSPAKILEELEKKVLQPNRVTYQRLMWRYCQEGDVEGATKVLEKMRALNMPVSEPVLNALVMGHAFHGDIENAKAVLETMTGAGLEPTNKTYTLIACGYAKMGDIDGVQQTIQTAKDKEAILTDRDILEIIEHFAVNGHTDKVDQLVPHLQKGIGYNQDVCNIILSLLSKRQIEASKKVLKTMLKSSNAQQTDTIFKGAFFVKQLLRLNKPPEYIINTCREVKNDGLVPNAFFIATECALANGQTELAQKLFQELKNEGIEIRQHYYWPLLVHKGKENDVEGLLQIVRDMNKVGMTVSPEALRDYVIPYLIKNDTPENVILKLQITGVPVIQSARQVMIHLLETGNIKAAADIALQYHPRGNFSLLTGPLTNALAQTKDITSFINILHVLSSTGPGAVKEDSGNDEAQSEDTTLLTEVSRIIKIAVTSLRKPDMCEDLLRCTYNKGLRINTATAKTIEQYFGENITSNLSQLLADLTASNIEVLPVERKSTVPGEYNSVQIEAQMVSLRQRGHTNLTRLQKQLLLAYMKENNVSKMNSYLEDLKSSNFEVTTATLAQLFGFYCQNNEIERAEAIKAHIAEKDCNFLLDQYKLLQMAAALVRANRTEEAMQYLIENKQIEQKYKNNQVVNSKCWEILNTLAEQENESGVTKMTETLIENNYVEPSSMILGPSIKVLLIKEDIDSALDKMEHFCNNYKCTPWIIQLMKSLILKEDANKLQRLADLGTQVHGEVNILYSLVFAFVECGRLRQARRILETLGLQTRHRRLDDACQRYAQEGKPEYLLGLLEASKDLPYIDRSNIYYNLLVTYCNNDETDKALGLWTSLQEDDEVPNEQFLQYLAQHLNSKGMKVPFAISQKKVVETKKKVLEKVVQETETTQTDDKTRTVVSNNIERMIGNGEALEAMNVTIKAIEKDKLVPKYNVLKYLIKSLAEEGNVAKIQKLESKISDTIKRRIKYNDNLTLSIFKKGDGHKHMDNLLKTVKTANTSEELEDALKQFPRSKALAFVLVDRDLTEKCMKIVEIAASKGILLPANLLWMEFILCGNDKEAGNIWSKYLNTAEIIAFRRLLQESHRRKDPKLIEKLISILKERSPVSIGSLGVAYSYLVNYHLLENNSEDAEKHLGEALKLGLQSENIKDNNLIRFKNIREESRQQLNL